MLTGLVEEACGQNIFHFQIKRQDQRESGFVFKVTKPLVIRPERGPKASGSHPPSRLLAAPPPAPDSQEDFVVVSVLRRVCSSDCLSNSHSPASVSRTLRLSLCYMIPFVLRNTNFSFHWCQDNVICTVKKIFKK